MLIIGMLLAVLLGGALLVGPSGCKTAVSSWFASSYGSDWFIVQYAQSGCVITSWELYDEAVKNEGQSDGIYFITPEGVVHLAGHYVYVQNPTDDAKNQLFSQLCFEE